MAPLVKALQACEQIESIVCLTGQHREMLDSVMEIFRLTGDYDLHIMEKRQTLSTITTKTLLGMDEVLNTASLTLFLSTATRPQRSPVRLPRSIIRSRSVMLRPDFVPGTNTPPSRRR